jgi:hypothetical protein
MTRAKLVASSVERFRTDDIDLRIRHQLTLEQVRKERGSSLQE